MWSQTEKNAVVHIAAPAQRAYTAVMTKASKICRLRERRRKSLSRTGSSFVIKSLLA